MGKELKNVFFGMLTSLSYRSIPPFATTQFAEYFIVDIELVDAGIRININAEKLKIPPFIDKSVREADYVQVTQWSDGTLTIEPFN